MAFGNRNSSGSANTVSVVKTSPNTVLDDVKTSMELAGVTQCLNREIETLLRSISLGNTGIQLVLLLLGSWRV